MAISIRSVTVAATDANPISVVTSESPTATQVGDLVVVVHGNDFYTAATMGTPTATGSPTINAITDAVADAGTNQVHIRGYWYVANTGGAQTISVTESGSADEDKVLVAYVLAGADTTTPVDDAANATGAAAESQPAPAVSPTTSDAFVIIHNNSGTGASAASYTSPGDVTERYEHHAGGMSGVGATKQLVASGDTGTFTFTASGAIPWGAVTIAIETAAAADVNGVGVGSVGISGAAEASIEVASVGVGGVGSTGVAEGSLEADGTGAGEFGIFGAGEASTEADGIGIGGLGVTGTGEASMEADGIGIGGLGVTGTGEALVETDGIGVGELGVTGTGEASVETDGIGIGVGELGVTGTGEASVETDGIGIGELGVTGTGEASESIEGSGTGLTGVTGTGVGGEWEPVVVDSATLILELSEALLNCLCVAVSGNPDPPQHCCYRVGTEPVHDISLEQIDLCCEGLAYVLVRDVYPSSESFPDNDIVRQIQGGCAWPAWAVGLRIGIVRCAPMTSDCDLNNEAFVQNIYDIQSINTAVCCFREFVRTSELFAGFNLVIERQVQGSTSGGCTERYVNLVAQIPNLDCSCG